MATLHLQSLRMAAGAVEKSQTAAAATIVEEEEAHVEAGTVLLWTLHTVTGRVGVSQQADATEQYRQQHNYATRKHSGGRLVI